MKFEVSCKIAGNGCAFMQAWNKNSRLPGTAAKFIILSSLLLLLLNRIPSAGTTDEIYSTAHCLHVCHACINANVVCRHSLST